VVVPVVPTLAKSTVTTPRSTVTCSPLGVVPSGSAGAAAGSQAGCPISSSASMISVRLVVRSVIRMPLFLP
jgi:hypothetical protein